MLKQPLHDGWSARAISNHAEIPGSIRDEVIPARVPGCIHTDLMRAGLIDDPYYGLNESKLTWIGRTDWRYTTRFTADAQLFDHERIDLVFDGLDTVATIILNGTEVARTQNMHRSYRFDIRKLLKKGSNELAIEFESPVNNAARMRDKLGYLPGIFYGGAYNFIRKMACNFGWDWGPIVPTCGIWRGVRVEGWSHVRLRRVQISQHLEPDGFTQVDIATHLEIASDPPPSFHVAGSIRLADGRRWPSSAELLLASDGIPRIRFEFHKPPLWWPKGVGEPHLAEIDISLTDYELDYGNPASVRIGLRTVELDTHPDDIGRAFVLKVNGKPIFCKGFNWIPDDCFLDRACTPDRYRKRIQQALDANANMLRVWGGGIYESDEFYDICDELGMLVWQDFPFACAAYPEAEPFKSEVEAEARENVARLASHPSLVLWNGCNENLWMYRDNSGDDGTGKIVKWQEQLKGKQWGQGYYLDLLPRIVKEVDPSRPYWAASPWSGDPDVDNGLHPNLATHGNKHIWEVWHGPGDYNNYRMFAPRFCSEFGYQGPANYATMEKYLATDVVGASAHHSSIGDVLKHTLPPSSAEQSPHPNPLPEYRARGLEGALTRGSAWLELHQKSPGGNERNDRLLAKDFDIPDNFDDWHYLLQLNQARALTTGVEWFRSRQPVCMGTLYWQLNDCYPVTSWSAIDSEGRLKPLWYATRRFFAARLLTIQPEGESLVLYANNDSDEPWAGMAKIQRIDFAGTALETLQVALDVPARGNVRVCTLPGAIATPADRARELIAATCDDHRALWYFASDRDLAYPEPKFDASLESGGLKITARTLLRDIVINIDRLDADAVIDDNVVTLLPGESHAFSIQSTRPFSVDQLTRPPVFQCANRFGKR